MRGTSVRAKPSKLLAAAKDLLERQKKVGMPPGYVGSSPAFEPPNTKDQAAEARALTEQLLQRAAGKKPQQG